MSNEISYKFNLILADNKTVIKAFDVHEEENKCCKITVLRSDYSKNEIENLFTDNYSDYFKSIIKTTKDDIFIRKYENYIGYPSIYEGSIVVPVDTVEEIETIKEEINENGDIISVPTTISVTNIKDVYVDVLFIEIPYISVSTQKLMKLESIIDPKLDIDNSSLDQVKMYIQKKNSESLELFLEKNPMLHVDGKYYGVSECDRNEMTQQYIGYLIEKSLDENAADTIKWHSKGTKCLNMEITDFICLVRAIKQYTEPYYEQMQDIKEKIMTAKTKEEVLSIKIFNN